LKEIRRAHRCFAALVLGQVRSVAELATVEGISDRYVSSLLALAFLAPEICRLGRKPRYDGIPETKRACRLTRFQSDSSDFGDSVPSA
jgi:hypothetical protein